MSKKKKILLIVLAVVLVAGGICWRILPDRLTSGTLKLSEDISLTHRLAAGKRGILPGASAAQRSACGSAGWGLIHHIITDKSAEYLLNCRACRSRKSWRI